MCWSLYIFKLVFPRFGLSFVFYLTLILKADVSTSGASWLTVASLMKVLYELGIVFNSGGLLVLHSGVSQCKGRGAGTVRATSSQNKKQPKTVFTLLLNHVFARKNEFVGHTLLFCVHNTFCLLSKRVFFCPKHTKQAVKELFNSFQSQLKWCLTRFKPLNSSYFKSTARSEHISCHLYVGQHASHLHIASRRGSSYYMVKYQISTWVGCSVINAENTMKYRYRLGLLPNLRDTNLSNSLEQISNHKRC